MNETFKRDMLRNIIWLTGLLLVIVVLVGGSLWRLQRNKSAVDQIGSRLEAQRAELEASPLSEEFLAELERCRETRLEWQVMLDSQPLRIAALSEAALDSGLSIMALESEDLVQDDAGPVLSRSHNLRGVGTHRQIAQFLDHLYDAPGAAAIDELEIELQSDLAPGLLETSMTVTWYAPGSPETEPAE